MKKCLLLGNGGREAVLAEYISKGYSLYSILPYENPTIVYYVKESKGNYIIGDPFDKELVKKFIQKEKIDCSVISSDNLLREGLIDLAKELGLETFGPTSQGAKIEWSKTYALEIVQKLAPEMIIKNYNITNKNDLEKVINMYETDNFVIKPEGLTGGKGVKVGGVHFKGKQEGLEYAKSCLEESGKVIVQDKVKGKEFTVMCLTDGENIVTTPITFDYPYRFDKDNGPGTGGMGCISFENNLLPFLNQEDVDKCADLMKKTIKYLNRDSMEFNGVLYGGFFKCSDGIKFIEFNSRFGDPEAINVLNSLETPFQNVLENIFSKNLNQNNCKFKKNYTFTVYVVSPEYAVKSINSPCKFTLNKNKFIQDNLKVYFSSSKKINQDTYTSVGNSRLFAIFGEGKNLIEVKQKVYKAMEENISKDVDYRKDIGEIR